MVCSMLGSASKSFSISFTVESLLKYFGIEVHAPMQKLNDPISSREITMFIVLYGDKLIRLFNIIPPEELVIGPEFPFRLIVVES